MKYTNQGAGNEGVTIDGRDLTNLLGARVNEW